MKHYIFRILGYILNVIILIIPVFLLADTIYFKYKELANMPNFMEYSILESLDMAMYAVFLPRIFIHAITKVIYVSEIFMFGIPAIISFVFFDSIISYFLKGDIGKKFFKLRIVTNNNEKAKFNQIFLRCVIKYLTIAFIPFCLVYPIFDKEKLMLHDKISRTRVM